MAKQNDFDNFSRAHYNEHFCDFFFNLDQCSGGDAILRYFFFRVLATILFGGLDLSD